MFLLKYRTDRQNVLFLEWNEANRYEDAVGYQFGYTSSCTTTEFKLACGVSRSEPALELWYLILGTVMPNKSRWRNNTSLHSWILLTHPCFYWIQKLYLNTLDSEKLDSKSYPTNLSLLEIENFLASGRYKMCVKFAIDYFLPLFILMVLCYSNTLDLLLNELTYLQSDTTIQLQSLPQIFPLFVLYYYTRSEPHHFTIRHAASLCFHRLPPEGFSFSRKMYTYDDSSYAQTDV